MANDKPDKDPKDSKEEKDSRDSSKKAPVYDTRNGIWVDPDTGRATPKDEGNGQLSDKARSSLNISNARTTGMDPADPKVKTKRNDRGQL